MLIIIAIGSPANFLDDDEPAPPAQPFQDKSAEIGNTKNQLNSTTMSLEAARAERRNLEDKVAEQTQQLQSLQMQLSTAKASYEGESNTLTSLKERHAGQQAEITKTREELIRAESDLSALKVERSEIEGAFLRDKEDARDLHRRMIETGKEADAIKAEVEKLKKDAKQQKGLLAIAKKQLSSKEADRAKAQKEYEEATAELNAITKEQAEVDAATTSIDASPVTTFVPSASPVLSQTSPVAAPFERIASPADSLSFAAAQSLPLTPDVTAASPSTSIRSNNPFDRLKAGNSTPRSQSPFASFSSPSANLQAEPQPTLGDDNIFDTKPFVEEPKPDSLEGLAYDSPEPAQLATFEVPNGQLAPDDTPASPNTVNETEFFHTPPTSAHLSPSLEAKAFPAIDDFTSTFALDEPPKAPQVGKVESKEKEGKPTAAASNDFDAAFSFDDNNHAKELEVDESDSDSEDEDEVPLSKVRQSVILAQQDKAAALEAPERADSFDDIFGGEPPKAEETRKPEVAQTENNFDDIFGGPIASPQTNGNGMPHPNAASPAAPVAGVDAFDEALGKISPTSSAAPAAQPFSFDSAFEDNFDFAAAKEEQGPSSAGSAPAPALVAAPPAADSTFDSIFTASGLNGHAEALKPVAAPAPVPQPAQPADPSANVNISFDDAFTNDLALTLNPPAAAAQRSPSPKPSTAPQALSPPTNGASNNPFPTVSPTASPSAITSPRPSSAHQRPASPFQAERILPQRTGSPVPKPRLSTSSSKEAASEKPKEPAPRHSKISVSSPFHPSFRDEEITQSFSCF
jgi:epidermal growth factor receptor substrate 15